jgi:hypothetical protein
MRGQATLGRGLGPQLYIRATKQAAVLGAKFQLFHLPALSAV